MKAIRPFMVLIVLFGTCSISIAQKGLTETQLKSERFTLGFTVGKSKSIKNIDFRTSRKKKLVIAFSNDRALKSLQLKPGTKVTGTFRFSQLSGTDLGSGRIMYDGNGILNFTKVMGPNGEAVGCPPLCEESVRLGLKVKE
jgi:hypothetical protein